MPDVLTDEELLAIAHDPDLSARLNSEERRRLTRLQGTATGRTWTDTAVDALPLVGGMVGGTLGAMTGIPTMGLTAGPGAVVGAGVLGAGGEAFKQLINRARGKAAPETPTEAATAIGTQGAVQAGSELLGQGVVKGAKAGARAVYRGFLKPSLAKQSLAKADQIVETALQEALPVTKAGRARAQVLIGALRGQVDDVLKQADAAGETVDLRSVAQRVRQFARSRYYQAGKPSADFDAAMQVADALDSHPALGGVTNVPLTKANQVKRGIDEAIGESNFGVDRGATKTAQKQARRFIREDIELGTRAAGVGDVGALNAREGRLLDAAKAINLAVGRESNKSPLIGVNTMLAGAVGAGSYAKNRDPYMAAVNTLATRALLTPEVATRAAIVAYRLGQTSGALPAHVARLAVQAVLAEEHPDE